MPFDIAPLMGGLASGVFGAAQSIIQAGQNKKQREWTEEMYARQRSDALADWNMMNAYNSPAEQMSRFKAAGLNPNLIYGQSNTGAVVRSSSPGNWNPQPIPVGDIGRNAVGSYFDVALKQQNLDNMKAVEDKVKQDTALAVLRGISEMWRGKTGKLGYEFKKDTYEFAKNILENQQLRTSADADTAAYKRDVYGNLAETMIQKGKADLENTLKEIALKDANKNQIFQNIENMKKSGELQDLEIQLRKLGGSMNDDLWQRIFMRILSGLGFGDWITGTKSLFNK